MMKNILKLHIISHTLREAELQRMQKSMCRERLRKNSMLVFVKITKIGISLIFTLQNGVEYMREKQAGLAKDVQTSVTFQDWHKVE